MTGNEIRFIRRKTNNTPPPQGRKSILKNSQKTNQRPSLNSILNYNASCK